MSGKEKRKRPLPGYRFFFNAFGLFLIVAASWTSFDLVTGKSGDAAGADPPGGVFYVFLALWFIVGISFLWYARLLATAELTTKHWKLGWLMIPLGVFTGFGIIFIFMALIWGDADVKANFKEPKPKPKPKPDSEPDPES